MSVNEAQVKQSVQNAIKTVLIDSKYHDEPITFGQAIVTHHFLQ
jgi:translation elongation factor EF-1beta